LIAKLQTVDAAGVGATPEAGDPFVVVDSIWKSYGAVNVLRGVSLSVEKGEVVCLIGPSGAGKSTFLRCVNHLERPDAGTVCIDSTYVGYRPGDDGRLYEVRPRELSAVRSSIGMVFQRFNLFPHMTALDNVAFGPRRLTGTSTKQARTTALELLSRVGLDGKAGRYPAQLSGGEQQRVAIARALSLRPKLMLFDEPTSALDPEVVGDVLAVIEELAADGMTMIVATHEMGFAFDAADRVVFMDDGTVVESGPPHVVLRDPQQERTRTFLARVLKPGIAPMDPG
jgi:polar amino acid transport system ATP-binding protein